MGRTATRKTNGKLRAIGYVRVSTAMQAEEGVSLDAQETRVRAYCTVEDWELVQLVVDAGESAGSLDRPGAQAVLAQVRAGAADVLVIYKLDRLFRNATDALVTSQELKRRGVALCSITEKIDTSTPHGKFFFTLTAAFAEMERDMIAARTREAMAFARTQGRLVGAVPFGYDLVEGNKLVPNRKEQTVIAEVLTRRQAGATFREIAKELMARGVRTKAGCLTWHPPQVQRLLERPTLYGTPHG